MRQKKQINIEIGEQIKLAREDAGITQEQLAEQVEVSPQYVSDLERGVVGVSIATLKRICISLQVSSDQILFGNKGTEDDHSLLLAELTPEQKRTLTEIITKIRSLL